MELTRSADGAVVTTSRYVLRVVDGRAWARLEDGDGPWADLCILASADTVARPDTTTSIDGPAIVERDGAMELAWRLGSSVWRAKRTTLVCREEGLDIGVDVEGDGQLADVTLLGGRAAVAPGPLGLVGSRAWFRTLLPAAPRDPTTVVVPADTSADSSASGGGEPGRPAWFFTPAPFWFGVTRESITDPMEPPAGRWLGFGLVATPEEQRFVGLGYRGGDRGFRFVLDYDGETRVTGAWRSPRLRLAFAGDPYQELAAYSREIAARSPTPGPHWWGEPMFCGWGMQCAAATSAGLSLSDAPRFSTQEHYDAALDRLESKGVVPGTIVIDDGWQAAYAVPEANTERWPDLGGWIRSRHDRGQRVLLWYKAWDPGGLPDGWTVRNAEGTPLAVDPNHPRARRAIADAVTSMLSSGGLDADGLKIDFTARTPTGAGLRHRSGAWGVGLLRRLLETVREAARAAKPDALLIGHVPEPSLAPLLDMIRLNDVLRLDDPPPGVSVVPHMAYRARVVRAACPGHLVDTDDWCMPDVATWRAYTNLKPELGVPSLYYADQLDLTGEMLTDDDYALLRRTWAGYREREGLAPR